MSRDVGVVGGSAAGLFTAYLLSRAGRRVRVLECAEDLEPKPRTLIVTEFLNEILGGIGKPAVVNEIRHFELFTDGRKAAITLRRPDLVIERTKLIRELAAAAQKSGVELLLGRRFVSLEQNNNHLALQTERSRDGAAEELHVDTVVGADGARSRVAQAAGWPAQKTVPLVQAAVALPPGMNSDTTRVWFIPDDTPYFYWLIPDSPDRGVVGLIGEDGPMARRALDRFLDKHHLEPLEYQAARIPVYSKWIPVRRRLGSGDVYLVGDAAGHVKVTTVGGIVTGFRGAHGVAEAILNDGRPGHRLNALRRELGVHWLVRKLLHNFTQTHYSHLVDLLSVRARQDLETYTRDEPAQMLWHLCLHQPRFLLVALRAFLTGVATPRRPETESLGSISS